MKSVKLILLLILIGFVSPVFSFGNPVKSLSNTPLALTFDTYEMNNLLRIINQKIQSSGTKKTQYINCSQLGLIWGGRSVNLLNAIDAPRYSNTVKTDGKIFLVDHKSSSNYYSLNIMLNGQDKSVTLYSFIDKQDALDAYEAMVKLYGICKSNQNIMNNHFGRLSPTELKKVRKEYCANIEYTILKAKNSRLGAKFTSVLKETYFFYNDEINAYKYMSLVFNQPANSIDEGTKINGFHVFRDIYQFNAKPIDRLSAENDNSLGNTSLDKSIKVGILRLNFAEKMIGKSSKNIYSDQESKLLGYKRHVASVDTKSEWLDLYYDNSEVNSGKNIVDYMEYLMLLEEYL